MHTSKSSEKYLFASFDNLDLRSFSSHMISQFWLKPSLSTEEGLQKLEFRYSNSKPSVETLRNLLSEEIFTEEILII